MPTAHTLPRELQAEIGEMISVMGEAGWQIRAARYEEQVFGNWVIDLHRNNRVIRLIKDRSQFMVDGSVEDLKTAGLLRAFDSLERFREAVVAWAGVDRK